MEGLYDSLLPITFESLDDYLKCTETVKLSPPLASILKVRMKYSNKLLLTTARSTQLFTKFVLLE